MVNSIKCYFCGGRLKGNSEPNTHKRGYAKMHRHINICQDPSIKYFCSHQCKVKWSAV